MAAAGYISVGDPYEECFADELIKMARHHYAHQAASTTKAVKVAHMGRAMARQQELALRKVASDRYGWSEEEFLLVKEALGAAGVKAFLGGAAKLMSRGAGAASKGMGTAAKGAVKGVGRGAEGLGNALIGGAKRVSGAGSRVAGRVRGAVGRAPATPKVAPRPTAAGKTSNPFRPLSRSEFHPSMRGRPGAVSQARTDPFRPLSKSEFHPSMRTGAGAKTPAVAPKPAPSQAPSIDTFGATAPGTRVATPPKPSSTVNTMGATPSTRPSAAAAPAKPPAAAKTPPPGPPAQNPATGAGGVATPAAQPAAGGAGQVATDAAQQTANAAQKKPGLLKRFFGGAREGWDSQDLGQLGDAGRVTRLGRHAGDVASGGVNMGSTPMKNIAGQAIAAPVAGRLLGGALNVGKRMVGAGGGSGMKQVVKSVGRQSSKAVGSLDEVAGMGLRNFGDDAMGAAASAGMSPRQLHAIDNLASLGLDTGHLPKRQIRKLERAAGVSLGDVQQGGVTGAVQSASRSGKAGRTGAGVVGEAAQEGIGAAVGQGGGEEAASAAAGGPGLMGRVSNFMNKPLGSPKARLAMGAAGVALPVAGGLGLYGAYHGINALARNNQQTAFQHGAYGAPINYNQTAMFPAGQVGY